MEVTEGKVDRAKDDYGLGRQYDLVFLVSDAAFLTAVKKSFDITPFDKIGTRVAFNVVYPEKMKTSELG